MQRILIVGGGLAGHRAAGALCRAGFEGELTLVGDERHRPYDRPPLSKRLLSGAVTDDSCLYPCDDLESVTWALGQPAAALDTETRVVTLADGEQIPYDGLVIATGRRARELPGLPELDGFHTLRSLDDSVALREATAAGPRVAIVGAGFIGCEVAATLRGQGLDVTLIDVASQPMPPLGDEIGRRAARIHSERGVRLRLGSGVEGFDGSRRVEAVRLRGGERLDADLVLIAVGSAPNSEWLAGSGLELHEGTVVCDERCFAAGFDDVVAAGDVASWPQPGGGTEPQWIEHWTNARDMGAVAAENLLAGPAQARPYAPVPTFWSDQYDVKIKSAGLIKGADVIEVVEEDPAKPSLVAEARRGDRLVGAVAFNRNRTIIDYQRKLAERVAA